MIWNVKEKGNSEYAVIYEVDQQIYEGEKTQTVRSAYEVVVHIEKNGAMVIVKNPTLAPIVKKSNYSLKVQDINATVDLNIIKEATSFLETFFKLYPTATQTKLSHYVANSDLQPINKVYPFSELVNPIFTEDGENIKVNVSVKFIDIQTKAMNISQYEFTLHKNSNWKIIANI